jgi:regulator of protease activity HflC (stomatin/prohibitin superfamily)
MNPITLFITVVLVLLGIAAGLAGFTSSAFTLFALAILVSASLKMANNWEKFVILRAGKFQSAKGPGLFLIVPILDAVTAVIDERIQTTAFAAEQALTKDTVLRAEISRKTADWGILVNSVEIRDVAIPVALQDAMSRQAQAEREKQARVILGSAEAEIAGKFVEAAKLYADNPAALHLRSMNIIYETTKERGATILIPTSMVDSMNIAGPLALALKGVPPAGS